MFSDRFSRFDTIPECVSHPATHPPSHVAVAITLYAIASSLKTTSHRIGFIAVRKLPQCFFVAYLLIIAIYCSMLWCFNNSDVMASSTEGMASSTERMANFTTTSTTKTSMAMQTIKAASTTTTSSIADTTDSKATTGNVSADVTLSSAIICHRIG